MRTLNRFALIVRPKRRYVEWANTLPDGPRLTLEEARAAPMIYLVGAQEVEDDEPIDLTALVDRYAEEIFDDQLAGWHTDEEAWPANRTPHVFRDWFDVELAAPVFDMDDDAALTEDDDVDAEFEEEDQEAATFETLHACAWCGRAIDEDEERFAFSMKLTSRDVVEALAGQAILWPFPASGRNVPVMVSTPESEARKAGSDLLFTLCSEACGKALKEAFERERGATLS